MWGCLDESRGQSLQPILDTECNAQIVGSGVCLTEHITWQTLLGRVHAITFSNFGLVGPTTRTKYVQFAGQDAIFLHSCQGLDFVESVNSPFELQHERNLPVIAKANVFADVMIANS